MSKKSLGLSIVIPARNEEDTVALVVDDCNRVLESLGIPYEIIVVDDGSTDGTREILSLSDCVYVANEGHEHGKGIALRIGFEASRYNTIVMMDADYSHRAEDIPVLWNEFDKGYGLVVGDRMEGGSDEYTLLRNIGNRFLTAIFSILFGIQMNDALNGFKIFDRRVYETYEYTAKDFSIEIGLLANTKRLGLSVGQIRSHERARRSGEPKSMPFRHGLSFLLRILYEKLRTPNIRSSRRNQGPLGRSS